MSNVTTLGTEVVNYLGGTPAGILCAVGLVILLVAVGLTKGKDSLLVLLFSLYPSALLAEYFPYYGYIQVGTSEFSNILGPLIVLASLTAMTAYAIKRYVVAGYQHHTFWRIVEVVALSLAIVGLCLALLYHMVGIGQILNFGPSFGILFISDTALFIWLTLSLLSIPLFVRA